MFFSFSLFERLVLNYYEVDFLPKYFNIFLGKRWRRPHAYFSS
jgi:hypothetical protein